MPMASATFMREPAEELELAQHARRRLHVEERAEVGAEPC